MLLDPLPEVSAGGILYPTQLTRTNQGLPKQHALTAHVLAAGREASYLVGTRVAFTRLYYGWLYKLADKRQVGFVDARNVLFRVDSTLNMATIEAVR